MRVMVTYEARLLKTRDGAIHSRGGPLELDRYLQVFDEVIVFARVEEVAQEKLDKFRLDGPNVKFFQLPYYVGPWQFLRQYDKIGTLAKQALQQEVTAFILRVPGTVGSILWRQLMKNKIPYGVEVVGDPWGALAPGCVKTILRPALRRIAKRQLVRQCYHASVASYVTEYTLQKRYPPGGWSTHYSSVELPNEIIADESIISDRMKRFEAKTKSHEPLRVCYAGTLAQLYKAPDVLIKAVANCIKKGVNLGLVIIGDGQFRRQLEKLTQKLGIAERVQFMGTLSNEKVFEELDEADLYVLPSLTEGLPKTIIEAMARGLPCVGSDVGGIPELLAVEDLVPPGDPHALAQKIEQIIGNRLRLEMMARRSLKSAHKYSKGKLDQRRRVYYEKLAEITESKRLPR